MNREWLEMMARYNRWQNGWVLKACDALGPEALEQDRGAFFGSIANTLRHVLWADTIWISRFEGTPPPEHPGSDSINFGGNWAGYFSARPKLDAQILDWAGRADPDGEIRWYSGILGREVTQPKLMIFTHFFNHQTHHRGQVHAMLTAAGVDTTDTDIIFMPDNEQEIS